MKPFTNLESRMVPLPINNVDTDQIIPARFLKTISKEGLDKQLFNDWRYDAAGNPKWYVAPNCTMASQGSCSGTLYQVTGPVFFGATFDPSKRNVTTAGSMSVNFSSNDAGAFTYNVGGIARTVAIQREPLA